MLSGKTQYYNSFKKESIKKLNSVSFCPNPGSAILTYVIPV